MHSSQPEWWTYGTGCQNRLSTAATSTSSREDRTNIWPIQNEGELQLPWTSSNAPLLPYLNLLSKHLLSKCPTTTKWPFVCRLLEAYHAPHCPTLACHGNVTGKWAYHTLVHRLLYIWTEHRKFLHCIRPQMDRSILIYNCASCYITISSILAAFALRTVPRNVHTTFETYSLILIQAENENWK